MSSATINQLAITGSNNEKIFNFNIFECYSLPEHFKFWDKVSDDVMLVLENGQVTFRYTNRLKKSGIILRMATIPSEIYHVFLTGQLVNGTRVTMRVRNRSPEFYLSPELSFKIGFEETRTACFRAISHQTDLIIVTDLSCVGDPTPFVFTIKGLDIIPSCLLLPGYFEGPQGVTGPQGLAGAQGEDGITFRGPQGAQGLQGPDGFQGANGRAGVQGTQGVQGLAGPLGPQGGTPGAQGSQGATGIRGIDGPIGFLGPPGTVGDRGALGSQGSQGPVGPPGNDGSIGAQGPQGLLGAQGPQGLVLGNNVLSGTFFMDWSRGGGPTVAIVIAQWQRTGNKISLNVPGFIAGPSGFGATLTSNTFPATIQTNGAANQSVIPIIIVVNGTATTVSCTAGPINLTIYGNLNSTSIIDLLAVVEVPSFTLTYLRN